MQKYLKVVFQGRPNSNDGFDIPILSLSISTVEQDTKLTSEVEFSLTMNGNGGAQHKCVYWNTTGSYNFWLHSPGFSFALFLCFVGAQFWNSHSVARGEFP